MRIRGKVILVFILIMGVLTVSLSMLMSRIILSGFAEIELQNRNLDIQLVSNQIDLEIAQIDLTNNDYSAWNETYDYMNLNNPEYPSTQIGDDSIRRLDFNLVALIDNNGSVRYLWAFDGQKNISEKFTNLVFQEGAGLMQANGTIFLFSSRQVFTTQGNGDPAGRMIMAKILDEKISKKMSEKAHHSIYFSAPSGKNLSAKKINGTNLLGTSSLRDVGGHPVLDLNIIFERPEYAAGEKSLEYLQISLFFTSFIFGVLFLIVLEKFVLNRLYLLSDDIKEISKETPGIMKLEGNDEITDLQKTIRLSVETLKQANKKLSELDQSKTDFLNMASHELRTPITAISLHLELLDPKLIAPTQKSSFEAIRRNISRLKMLIGNIIEISRLQSRRLEIVKTDVDIENIISRSIESLRVFSEKKNLIIEVKASGLPRIKADSLRFEEIVTNILDNAIKFTENGVILLEAFQESNKIILRVTDNGPGISKEKMESLFRNLYQDLKTSKQQSSGMGLSISKVLIDLHGWTITVVSEEKKGTIVTVIIPAVP